MSQVSSFSLKSLHRALSQIDQVCALSQAILHFAEVGCNVKSKYTKFSDHDWKKKCNFRVEKEGS